MTSKITLMILCLASIAAAQTRPATRPADLAGQAPVKLIFDCDMDSDCDDAGALGVLHALADRKEVELLAVMTSSLEPNAGPCIDAINKYYGRQVPIGLASAPAPLQKSKYTKAVADRSPHDFKAGDKGPGAVPLYKQLLSAADDHSITVVTTGDMTNLAKLMADPQDVELVRTKVKFWACMGGNFIGKPAKDDLKLGNNNFTVDAKATYAAITQWPTPIVFCGREMCSVPSGLKVGAHLANTPADNPVRIAYEAYFNGKLQDRHVADLATVLYAVRGLANYWDAEQSGAMDLQKDMTFTWRYDLDRPQAYLLKKHGNDREVEKVIDELLIQKPAAK
jgi:inosine-uridine nucleoside N-ribohydrolase